jgi:recombination DNA repair RAD52 pathway protein
MFQENLELTKEVQDLKVNLENSTYLKSQLAGQLEDARRRLEDDERVKKNPITDKIKKSNDTYNKILSNLTFINKL